MKKDGERYDKIFEQMELLGITDVTTNRQHRNSTVVWRLPIKNNNSGKTFIEVASFSTGYVRNQNSGYSNYQLNKRCEGEPEYFQLDNGDYRKFSTRSCVLISNEIDRLEYLITYCLKNYYIKRANQVAEGSYVSKWYHEWELERNQNKMEEICHLDANAPARIGDLEEKLDAMTEDRDCKSDRIYELESQVDVADNKLSNAISPTKYQCVINKLHDLENKLATINRISE